jgi:hypothetical protein
MALNRRYPTYIKLLLGCLLAVASAIGNTNHHVAHDAGPVAAAHHQH